MVDFHQSWHKLTKSLLMEGVSSLSELWKVISLSHSLRMSRTWNNLEHFVLNQGVGILIALLNLVYCEEQFLRCQSHVIPSSPVTFPLQVSKTPPPWPHIWPLQIVAFGRRHPDPQQRPASIRKGPHMYGRTATGAAQGMDLSAASQGEPDQNNLLRWRANSYDIWFQ